MNLSWKAEAVLADEYYKNVESILVFAAEIHNKTRISSLVKNLTEKYPLGRLQHLKRVGQITLKEGKKMLVIIRTCASNESYDTLDQLLSNDEQWEGLSSRVYKCQVPKHAPLTRMQYEECIALWPTQFHENKHIAKVISGEIFDGNQNVKMQEFMRQAVSAAKLASGIAGAVVVEPKSNQVITVAVDQRHQHPLHHVTMVAISQVAQGQKNASTEKVSVLDDTDSKTERSPDNLPYLCTGYDLYVTREPCTMCAMALVHSRIGRVFYGRPSNQGALGSLLKLHTNRMLNHRYQVWKGICGSECEELS